MTPDPQISAGSPRDTRGNWAWLGLPSAVPAYLAAVEFVAIVATIATILGSSWSSEALLRTSLLIAFGILFEEVARKAARMRILLSDYLQPDMTSVWCFAGAIVLPPPYAISCTVVLTTYLWFRQWRGSGGRLYLKVGSGAIFVLSSITAHQILLAIHARYAGVAGVAAGILIAMVAYGAINRVLVTVALVIRGVKWRDTLTNWDDSVLEVATLCLGGLVALAVMYQPPFMALVILPMFLLQRGAVVRQLEVAATTDNKTGLFNAVAWEQLAQRDLARASREKEGLAVLIIDVDKFKAVNDDFGHLAGDIALKAIGDTLTRELRGYDSIGRFGGEEFVACLPNTDEVGALGIAERVRHSINQIRLGQLIPAIQPEVDRYLAVSIGVAFAPTDGTELTDLLHAADAALYVAKDTGRNRVELAIRGTGGTQETVTV